MFALELIMLVFGLQDDGNGIKSFFSSSITYTNGWLSLIVFIFLVFVIFFIFFLFLIRFFLEYSLTY